ncbi:unnamed protein product [Linum trigynum]|uniref:Uncharacterized protein n=1 Tax=Linum trigynum TaxID=586398 RepID=A0AAV2EK23_9ROSI
MDRVTHRKSKYLDRVTSSFGGGIERGKAPSVLLLLEWVTAGGGRCAAGGGMASNFGGVIARRFSVRLMRIREGESFFGVASAEMSS